MNENIEISNAEWEVMRILWTLKMATSRQIIDLLAEKLGWKEATTKTYNNRLVNKQYVTATRQGRAYLYRPAVAEDTTIKTQLMNSFAKICQKHVGKTLANVIEDIPLSQTDIAELIQVLERKQKTAPSELPCDCLPEGYGKHAC